MNLETGRPPKRTPGNRIFLCMAKRLGKELKRLGTELNDGSGYELHSVLPKICVLDRSEQTSSSAVDLTSVSTNNCREAEAEAFSRSDAKCFSSECPNSDLLLSKVKGKNKLITSESVWRQTEDTAAGEMVDNNDMLAKSRPQNAILQRLNRNCYDVPCEELARALLGQRIVRIIDGVRIAARIVETEAYLGSFDKAAHSYKGQTDRNKAMFMLPGTAYVYNIYGMYCCLNISSQGEGAAVLIRSVEPVEGTDRMLQLRRSKSSSKKPMKPKDVGNGPSKLCQSLDITKAGVNQRDLVTDAGIWMERDVEVPEEEIVVSARVNVGYAEEWTDKPLRFYVHGNACVSVRDRKAEAARTSSSGTSRYFDRT